MKILHLASSDFNALVKYVLQQEDRRLRIFSKIIVWEDPNLSKNKKRKNRSFAYVLRGEYAVFANKKIEYLPIVNRIGILLHELSHLVGDTMDSEEQEVDTDLWILKNFPESSFHYEKKVVYFSPEGDKFEANNLQTVSEEFADMIHKE